MKSARIGVSTTAGWALAAALDGRLQSSQGLEDRIRAIAEMLGGGVSFSTSLGLEDQAVLHAIAASGTAIDVFALDTGRHFPETLETIVASERRYGLRIRIVAPEADDLERLVTRDGLYGFRASIEARKACCEVRKVRPLRRALAGAAGWVTGLRRGQSRGRHDVPLSAFDADMRLVKANPLADWSLEQLEKYIRTHNIPVNPLHAEGFPSIGCQPCTRAVRPGEDIRAGRWWWESMEGKECGLHGHSAMRGAPE